MRFLRRVPPAPPAMPPAPPLPRPPVPAILIIHVIRCRACGQSWTGEELDIAGIRITSSYGTCGCTCTDPAVPGYEDWVADAQ